jgi:hypothetical protein
LSGSSRSISNDAGYTVQVGVSQLAGALSNTGGSFACFGVYDGSFAPVTCP